MFVIELYGESVAINSEAIGLPNKTHSDLHSVFALLVVAFVFHSSASFALENAPGDTAAHAFGVGGEIAVIERI